jgi:hypothetical protein
MDEQALVYMKTIRLEVVIPEKHVWEFMKEFGEQFAYELESTPLEVELFFYHPNGWHVIVVVEDQSRFNSFFVSFCQTRGLTFRDPRDEERR